MITSLRLKNFKCYEDSGPIPFAPLTVIIGCNNAGKSSILQSLLLLLQTLRDPSITARLVTRGAHVDLGGFFDILHGKGDLEKKKQIGIELSREPMGIPTLPGGGLRESTRLDLSFSCNRFNNEIRVRDASFFAGKDLMMRCMEAKGKWNAPGVPADDAKYIDMNLRNFLPQFFLNKQFQQAFGKSPGGKDASRVFGTYTALMFQSDAWARFILGDIEHISPVRSHMPFYCGAAERTSSELGSGGEDLTRVLAAKRKVLKGKLTLLESVNFWMGQKFGALNNIQFKPLDRAGHIRSLIADDPGGQPGINIAAMGEGVSQVLPIVAAVLGTQTKDCLLIEQPEIHLHPSLQADLGDLFLHVVNVGDRQLVVETHSEHLLLRLRRRIAEGLISPDKVSILFVEKKDGVSSVRRLDLNKRGHFADWPKGFFDQAYQDAMALAMFQPLKD